MTSLEEQTREWYAAIGEFVVKFEHAIQAARTFLVFDLNTDGTAEGQQRIATLLSLLQGRELVNAVRLTLKRSDRLTDERKSALQQLDDLCERRNSIVHSAWFIGWSSSAEGMDDPTVVTAVVTTKKANADGPWLVKRLKLEDLRDATIEAEQLTVELHRLWGT